MSEVSSISTCMASAAIPCCSVPQFASHPMQPLWSMYETQKFTYSHVALVPYCFYLRYRSCVAEVFSDCAYMNLSFWYSHALCLQVFRLRYNSVSKPCLKSITIPDIRT
jgi:hypothetical protein